MADQRPSFTRGLFTGWLKGLVMLALVPLFAVLGGSVMLELAVPVLAALVQTPGMIDPQAAMAFFVIGAVHMALMVMVLKVTGTMVSGWRVFGLVPDKLERGERAAAGASAVVAPLAQAAPVQATGGASDRRIPVSSFAVAPPANDGGALGEGGRRETRSEVKLSIGTRPGCKALLATRSNAPCPSRCGRHHAHGSHWAREV